MKNKLFKTLAATAMSVLAIACAKEPVADNGQQAGVSFTVEVPGASVTKAYGEAEKATKLYYQVFDNTGAPIEGLGVQTTDLVGKAAKVSFQLVKDQTYNFVFWAQTTETGYYTIDETEGLKKIKANYTDKLANDENFDAFYAVKKVKISGPVSESVELTRPFAQINIATKGVLKAGETETEIDFTGATSSVTIKNVPTEFFPLSPAASQLGSETVTAKFKTADAPSGNMTVNSDTYKYLALNYVFAPTDGTVYDITAKFSVDGKTVNLNVPAVPAKRNWRTNILGSLLTSSVDINVVVDPNFGGNEDIDLENIKNEASLKALFANGGTAKLASDFTVSEPIVLEGKKVVNLNLNGKTLTFNGGVDDEHCCMFRVHEGTLTIDGNGNINGGGDAHNQRVMFLAKGTDAHIVINDGNFKMGKTTSADHDWYDCVYALAGGQIDIHGGTFETEATRPNGKHYILNLNNGNPGTITVDGGKFVNYDPTTGDDNIECNFVADGYTTKASFDKNTGVVTYSVVKVTASATDEATLSAALSSKNGAVISVSNDLEVSYIPVEKSVTLNLNGSTLNCIEPESLRANSGSSLNITGKGTIVAVNAAPGKQTSAVVVRNGGTVNVYDGVTLDGGNGSDGNYAVRLIRGTANIYGGYFHSGNDKNGGSSEVIYLECEYRASSRVYLNIYGGIFECDGDAKYLINIQDDYRSKCTAKIYGGTFVGFDPANVNEGTITSFVADGYKSVETTYNGKQAWEVVKE